MVVHIECAEAAAEGGIRVARHQDSKGAGGVAGSCGMRRDSRAAGVSEVLRSGKFRVLLASIVLFATPTALSQTPKLRDDLCWINLASGHGRLPHSSFWQDTHRHRCITGKPSSCSSIRVVPDVGRFLSLRPAAVGTNPQAFQDGHEHNMSVSSESSWDYAERSQFATFIQSTRDQSPNPFNVALILYIIRTLNLKCPTVDHMAPFSEENLSQEDGHLVYTWDGDLMPRYDPFSASSMSDMSYGDGEFPVYTYDGEENPFVLKVPGQKDRYDRWDTYDTDFVDPRSKQFAQKINFTIPSSYDWNATTCFNYELPDGPGKFFGKYQEVRADLDYTYHVNFVEQRQYLQDEIVSHWTQCGTTSEEPWIIFTAGAMGSGKSQTLKSLGLQGVHSLYDMVTVDPDGVKYQLPEMQHYIKKNPGPKPDPSIILAGEATHNESAYLQEIIVRLLLDSSKHLIVDGSLSNAEWYSEYFAEIRRRYPHYRIGILHVMCDPEVIWERVQHRCLRTGRCIERSVVDESVAMTPMAVSRLAPLTDFTAVIDSGTNPVRFIRAQVAKGKVRTAAERVQILTPQGMGLEGDEGIPVDILDKLLRSRISS